MARLVASGGDVDLLGVGGPGPSGRPASSYSSAIACRIAGSPGALTAAPPQVRSAATSRWIPAAGGTGPGVTLGQIDAGPGRQVLGDSGTERRSGVAGPATTVPLPGATAAAPRRAARPAPGSPSCGSPPADRRGCARGQTPAAGQDARVDEVAQAVREPSGQGPVARRRPPVQQRDEIGAIRSRRGVGDGLRTPRANRSNWLSPLQANRHRIRSPIERTTPR